MRHRQKDEAIGDDFNGFEWVEVHATDLAKPNVLSAWLQCCGRREVLVDEMFQASNLTVDAQWDKMSMTRRNWRVVWDSPHAPRWPSFSAKRAVFGVAREWAHVGVTQSGQEACGVQRGTCCAEGMV